MEFNRETYLKLRYKFNQGIDRDLMEFIALFCEVEKRDLNNLIKILNKRKAINPFEPPRNITINDYPNIAKLKHYLDGYFKLQILFQEKEKLELKNGEIKKFTKLIEIKAY